jgi:hypothetical protein
MAGDYCQAYGETILDLENRDRYSELIAQFWLSPKLEINSR